MAERDVKINLRLPSDLNAWLEARAGGRRRKPGYIRRILERERAREDGERMLEMFNAAWDSLSPEERAEVREEREDWIGLAAAGPHR